MHAAATEYPAGRFVCASLLRTAAATPCITPCTCLTRPWTSAACRPLPAPPCLLPAVCHSRKAEREVPCCRRQTAAAGLACMQENTRNEVGSALDLATVLAQNNPVCAPAVLTATTQVYPGLAKIILDCVCCRSLSPGGGNDHSALVFELAPLPFLPLCPGPLQRLLPSLLATTAPSQRHLALLRGPREKHGLPGTWPRTAAGVAAGACE